MRRHCSIHTSERLNFYCKTHRALLCQECLLDGHLGCELTSSKELIGQIIVREESTQLLKQVQEHQEELRKPD